MWRGSRRRCSTPRAKDHIRFSRHSCSGDEKRMAEGCGDLREFNEVLREQTEGGAFEVWSCDRSDSSIPAEHEDPTVPSHVLCIVSPLTPNLFAVDRFQMLRSPAVFLPRRICTSLATVTSPILQWDLTGWSRDYTQVECTPMRDCKAFHP